MCLPSSGGLAVIDQTGQVAEGIRRIGAASDGSAAGGIVQTRDGIEPDGRRPVSGPGSAVAQRAVMGESTHRNHRSQVGALEQEKNSWREAAVSGGSGCWSFTRMLSRRMPRAIGRVRFVRPAEPRHPHPKRDSQWRGRCHCRRPRARGGIGSERIDALTTVARPATVTVTAYGESATRPDFGQLLPMGFALLLMISVMSSGQYLLTTTIEEKSSRTMEVILSAVSPFELLTGKILGQMAVGLTILITYSSIGILAWCRWRCLA